MSFISKSAIKCRQRTGMCSISSKCNMTSARAPGATCPADNAAQHNSLASFDGTFWEVMTGETKGSLWGCQGDGTRDVTNTYTIEDADTPEHTLAQHRN